MDIMNLTVGQIVGGSIGILAVISFFIEITPIKINPISAILKWIGKRTNKELLDDFKELKKKVDVVDRSVEQIREDAEKRNAITCRVRIIHFGDEILHGVKHSKESFDQVLSDIDDYERYCDGHPDFKNNKTVITTERIKANYAERLEKNDFL